MADLLSSQEIFFTAYEPKVANRFIMNIDGVPGYLIKAAGRPQLANNPVILDHINLKRKIKGKSEWQDIEITLYDPIVPSAAQAIMEWVRLGHESVTGRNGYAEFYKKTLQIDVLGPPGDKIERWSIYGAFPASVNFNGTALDWSNGGDPLLVNVTIAMDYCVLEY